LIPRHISPAVQAALADTRVVLLHGARQTGKSTLARWLAAHSYPARYLTLDDAGALSAARSDPRGFVAGFEGPVVLDEIQRAPELFLAIKAAVDLDPRPGRFLLTGSANVLLLPQLADSLAGRMEILTLWPFSQGELAGRRETFIDRLFSNDLTAGPLPVEDRATAIQRILTGGYPSAVSRGDPERRRAWFGSYLTTILQRDIRDLAHIERLTELPALLSLLATRAGSLLNFAALARGAALPQSTLKRYMALLETAFLLQYLPAWSANLGKRLVKAPKLILTDTGLMAHLLGLNADRLAAEPMFLGSLLENFVAMELRKQAGWSRTRAQLYHFRFVTGQEVDILLEDAAGNVVGVEIKAGATVSAADFRGLHALAAAAGPHFRCGVVLYLGGESIPFGAGMYALPLPALWASP
jgi:predicted AAA+ superfamily ATPase